MAKMLPAVPKKLTPEDKEFIKRYENGEKKARAFRNSYPNHPAVIRYHNSEVGSPDRQKAMETIVVAAKTKLQAKYMRNAIVTYQDAMEKFSELSLDTATELVVHARSEKVRADLAIEGIRHKVGTPVQKVAVQEQKTVILTFQRPSESTAGHSSSKGSSYDS